MSGGTVLNIEPLVATPSIKFTGGINNGAEVVDWLANHGGTAEWMRRQAGLKGYPDLPEHICITKGSRRSYVWIGRSIVKDDLSGFVIKTMSVQV